MFQLMDIKGHLPRIDVLAALLPAFGTSLWPVRTGGYSTLAAPTDITNGGFLKWGIPKTMGFKWFQY
jgi:hypothetical protein